MQNDGRSPPPLPTSKNEWALFLDVDGTLAAFEPRPEQVVIPERTLSSLAQLKESMGGAVAIVSGRPIEQIDRLFTPLVLPAGGLHGLEWRNAQSCLIERPGPPHWHGDILAALRTFASENPGARVEDKSITLALHYRQAPDLHGAAQALAERLNTYGHTGLVIQTGKMIVEFRPQGADKGDAIARFLDQAPFAGRRPIFLGDDATDEHGFHVVKKAGGYAVRIGNEGETAADWCLPTVEDSGRWLADVAHLFRDQSAMEKE